MSSGDGPNLVFLVVMLVVVASSLISMRLPLGKTLKMVAAWVAIFGAGFILFSFRSDFTALGQRLKAEAIGTPIQQGEELRIPMAEDGHFWVDASINGHSEPFLIDSGASVTTISREAADQAGIETGIRIAMVETANGTVQMHKARAEQFQVGSIERADFAVQINSHDETNVIGMNFLSSLGSWRVEGNYLVLKP